jgi:hypothetical protein
MINCWYYRGIISTHVDAEVALPDSARAHVQNCQSCRQHYETETGIARQLSAAARAEDHTPSSSLHARILSSLANERTGPERRPLPGALPFALGTACVLVVSILWIVQHRSPTELNPPVTIIKPTVVEEWPQEMKLGELAVKLDEPLQNEMNLVVNDTKIAMDSLARNFIPEAVRSYFVAQAKDAEL